VVCCLAEGSALKGVLGYADIGMVTTGGLPIADDATTLETWVTVAEGMDLFDLALELRGLQHHPEEHLVSIARLHLLSGDFAGARSLLRPSADEWTPPPGTQFRQEDMLLAACEAAAGNPIASTWLLAAASALSQQGDAWIGHYLVALAADARGDLALGAQAWTTLVMQFGIRTELTIPRWAAAHVAHRDPHEAKVALANVVKAGFAFRSLPHQANRDPRPILNAANFLVAAGDPAGARLLLEMVARSQPRSEPVLEALVALSPNAAMRRYRMRVRALLVVAFLLIPLGYVWAVGMALGRVWFRQHVRVPGLSATDSQVWRALRRVRYDPAAAAMTPLDAEVDGLELLLILLGLSVGGLGGYGLAAMVGGWFGVSNPLTDLPLLFLWLFVLVAVPAVLVVGKRYLLRWARRLRRLRAQEAAERLRLRTASTCQCWETSTFRDDFADVYSQQHLAPMTTAQTRTLAVELAPGRAVLACPVTGALWLRIDRTPEGAVLLIRGDVPVPDATSPTPTGFYL
jgi:hypothetical protein